MKYILILLFVFIISCGNDDKNDFDCSSCKENEICKKEEKKCVLKEGFDCSQCEEYEICNEEKETCSLKDGACLSDNDCKDDEKCNLQSNSCESKDEPIVCNENETKCDSNELLTCVNNTWVETDCEAEGKECQTEEGNSFCAVIEGTIYPIRHGDIAENTQVSVVGIVTGVKLDNNDKISGFYIQEKGSEYRGIFVYAKNRLENTLILGDEVSVSGVYKEYNGLSEIIVEEPTQVVKTGNNNPLNDFVLLDINELVSQRVERYESMLVRLKGSFIVGERDQYYNLSVKDSDGKTFYLRDDLYDTNLNTGDKLTEIRGVLTYNYGKFKIFPRGEYDLIDNSELCSSVSCGNGEVCDVEDGVADCVCDIKNGYYSDNDGNCKNPCSQSDGLCNQENKHKCVSLSATDYECACDDGFVEDDNGNCSAQPYCDEATYSSAFGLTGEALKAELKIIINRGYHNYGYDAGRLAMFSHIDNDNGVIRCVYTGEYANHPYSEDPATQTKPDNDFFNWEHTWPHSLLGTNASSDLHHLFPTRSYVNSRRSNYPFGNVDGGDRFCDDGIDGPGTCSDSEYDYVSKLKNQIFEPADQHKGNVARAMLYMWIKYDNPGGFMDRANQFQTFREWNRLDPVDNRERLRNSLVEYYQGNRNPFVDCPQFVDALYE